MSKRHFFLSIMSHSGGCDRTKENAWNTLRWRSGSIDDMKEGLSDKKTQKSGTIGLWSLSVLVFYAVNGGAFGIEDIVAAGGAYFALIGWLACFIIVFLVTSVVLLTRCRVCAPLRLGSTRGPRDCGAIHCDT